MAACVCTGGALAASASASPVTLNGTVGPSFPISLAKAGAKVKSLKSGAYRVVVNDRGLVTRDYAYFVENQLRRRLNLEGVPVIIDFESRS